MKSLRALPLFLVWLFLGFLTPAFAQSSQDEVRVSGIRGIWVDGFNPGIKSRAEVDALIARAQKAKLNAIFAQVRKRGDAYYASRYEPLATDNRNISYDPLAYLIEKAHAATPRITIHAWINMGAVGPPQDPHHILAKHPDWRSLSDTGATYDDEAIKIDPGVPDAADWTFRIYLDIVRRYDVDGIHFDFVRYGGAHWGYAPESVARFQKRAGHTSIPKFDEPQWQQWRRDQVTALVRKVYVNAIALKPGIVVSAATITWGDAPKTESDWERSSAFSDVFQDWRSWLEEGILDLACPMTYFRAGVNRAFQERWASWVTTHTYHRAATMAVAAYLNSPEATLDLARLSLQAAPAGILFYCYGNTRAGAEKTEDAFFSQVAELFPDNVPFPSLAGKAHSATGHLKGSVLTGSELRSCDGAAIRITALNGPKRAKIREADGTGFYAVIDLPPGDYEVVASYEGEISATQQVTITPGGVVTADFLLQAGELPAVHPVYGIGAEAEGARVLLRDRLVTVGNDALGDRFYLADIPGGAYVAARFKNMPAVPLVAGDRVTLTGIVQKENGLPVLIVDACRLTGMTGPE